MSGVNEDLGLPATKLTPPVGGSAAWLDLQDSSDRGGGAESSQDSFVYDLIKLTKDEALNPKSKGVLPRSFSVWLIRYSQISFCFLHSGGRPSCLTDWMEYPEHPETCYFLWARLRPQWLFDQDTWHLCVCEPFKPSPSLTFLALSSQLLFWPFIFTLSRSSTVLPNIYFVWQYSHTLQVSYLFIKCIKHGL